jgi:hypothetical protein
MKKQHYELSIDFDLLRDQKIALIDMLDKEHVTSVEGIVALLDELEDQAIAKGYCEEEDYDYEK